MANLLDQASIVLTPTAYDNGKVLCAKPSEPPYGDFDFSRNSAATRVNAQGLVENVQTLSSNLVQNGDFSEEGSEEVSNGSFSQEGVELVTNGDFATDTDWNKVNATIGGGTGNLDSTSGVSLLFQQSVLTVGKTYKAILDVTNYNGLGTCALIDSNGNIQFEITSNGNKEFYFTQGGSSTNLSFRAVSGGIFSIDNVSVREVGKDWILESGWSIGEDKAVATNVDGTFLKQNSVLTTGKTYKITYTVQDYSSGSVRFRANSVNGTTNSGNGTYTDYIVSGGTQFALQGLSTFNGSITNISVKEVGQNWDFGTGWSIGNDVASYDDLTDNAILSQAMPMAASKKFQLSFTILNGSGARMQFTDNTGLALYNLYGEGNLSNGDYSFIFNTASSVSGFRLYGYTLSGGAFDITNISVIEITDDTSLPRINYEGFSYQDVLGSELITNGDFATDSDWIKQSSWTISNGTANYDGISSGNYLRQSWSPLTIGKTYRMTFDISDGSAYLQIRSGTSLLFEGLNIVLYGTGSHVIEAKAISNLDNLRIYAYTSGGGTSFSIDNVSVKEVTGQEVVPDSGCGSWLFEPQSTNLITYSEDFSQSYWAKQAGITATYNTTETLSPDGTYNATKFVGNGTTGVLKTSISVSGVVSRSVYLKSVTGTTTATFKEPNTNVPSPITLTITNEWQRFEMIGDNGSSFQGLQIDDITSDGIYMWGAQLEEQTYATSYIPTNGEANGVTRNQDLCTNGGSLASINSTEGVLYAEIAALADNGTSRRISLSDGTSNNRLSMIFGSTTNNFQCFSFVNNSVQFNFNQTLSNVLQLNKIAIKYSLNNFSLFVNGVKIAEDNSGNIWALNTLNVIDFNDGTGTNNFFGKTKALAVWKEALSDEELADLTYPTPTDPTFALDFDTIATDFTFARGSEATYVDAQGLIQSTNELGPELVTNGDFATDSDWVKGTGWSISGGTANCDGVSSNSSLYQNVGGVNNTIYKITGTISNYVSGTLQVGGSSNFLAVNSNGDFVHYRQWTSDSTLYLRSVNFIGSIDNVSVKEYITATNTPRLDYSTGAEAFLLEPQSTNLVTQSEALSTMQNQSTITDNILTSPTGNVNASLVVENTATNSHGITKTTIIPTNPSATSYTISIFAKKKERQYIQFWLYADSTSFTSSGFDLENGTTSGDANTHKIKDFGNGWYRCSFTANVTQSTGGYNFARVSMGTSLASFYYTGDGASGLYMFGFQLEQQSYATSYIPTSGSTVTRNQETCINATPEINSEEGVLYAEIAALADDGTNRIIGISDGTNGNRVQIYYSTASNSFIGLVYSGGGLSCSLNTTLANATDFIKVALKYKENDFALWVNGVEVATDTNGNSPIGLDRLDFRLGVGILPFFGNTKDLQVYTKALSDAELIKLTT